MSSTNKPFTLLLYNTQNLPKEIVKQDFVIRRKQYQSIWNDICTAKMAHPEQHFIVQGLRGSRKTMLLLKLAYAVEEHEQLKTWLIPVLFKEEEYKNDSIPFFVFLISKRQYHGALNLLNQFHLKERFKPLYYALMHFLEEEYPNELLRMGDELKETVDEIIAEVQALKERYG